MLGYKWDCIDIFFKQRPYLAIVTYTDN
jgi:hypothetical protein